MKIIGRGAIIRREDKPRKDCRKWEIEVKTDQGRKHRRFTGTYTQALTEKERYIEELQIPAGREPFAVRAQKWLDRRKLLNNNLSQATIDKDTRIVTRLNSQFGKMQIGSIDRATALDGLLDLKESNGYGGTYMASLFRIAKAIFRDAVADGEIASNPLDGVKAPKPDKTKRRALSEPEYQTFMTMVDLMPIDSFSTALKVDIYTGLRRGELLGLQWDDFDASSRRLFVRRSISDKGVAGPPKGGRERIIPIPNELVRILDEWQRVQEGLLSAIGIKQTLETPILHSANGKRLGTQSFERWWRGKRDEIGFPGLVPHELRHTYLTRLAHGPATTGKDLQDIAGWSSMAMADVYVHEDEESKRRAVDALFESA